LVLGVGDPGHSGEKLTDTLMLLSLNSTTKRMAQVSIPRDLRVNVPGHGYSKINAANVYGGVTVAEQTVSDTLGVPIDYYLKTNFSGLKDLVDAVGGIDVDVKQRLTDSEYPCDDNQYKVCGLDIKPGLQHMDGTLALQYVRCRKGTCGNDFGRAERQQEVLGLLRPKLTDWHLALNPMKLKLVAEAAQKGISTDMGLIQLLQLANGWRESSDNQPVHLVLSTAPGGYLRSDPGGSSDLLPVGGNFSAVSKAVQGIFTTE
jgi:LCP family protein required for cell wall assembly